MSADKAASVDLLDEIFPGIFPPLSAFNFEFGPMWVKVAMRLHKGKIIFQYKNSSARWQCICFPNDEDEDRRLKCEDLKGKNIEAVLRARECEARPNKQSYKALAAYTAPMACKFTTDGKAVKLSPLKEPDKSVARKICAPIVRLSPEDFPEEWDVVDFWLKKHGRGPLVQADSVKRVELGARGGSVSTPDTITLGKDPRDLLFLCEQKLPGTGREFVQALNLQPATIVHVEYPGGESVAVSLEGFCITVATNLYPASQMQPAGEVDVLRSGPLECAARFAKQVVAWRMKDLRTGLIVVAAAVAYALWDVETTVSCAIDWVTSGSDGVDSLRLVSILLFCGGVPVLWHVVATECASDGSDDSSDE